MMHTPTLAAPRDGRDVTEYMNIVTHVVRRANLEPKATFDRDDMHATGNLALWESSLSYDPTRGAAFATYAYSKVRWALYGAYREQFPYRHDRYDVETDTAIHFVPVDSIVDSEFEERYAAEHSGEYLGDMFGCLTKREAHIIKQYFWRDRSGTDIAKELGVSQSGVNRSLRTALDKMREHLVGWN